MQPQSGRGLKARSELKVGQLAWQECREASPGTGESYNRSYFSYPCFWEAKQLLNLRGRGLS